MPGLTPSYGTAARPARKTITFTGAANLGASAGGGACPLFTVTGQVLVVVLVPYCTTNIASSGGTLALGVVGSTALFIAATTGTDIDAGEFWVDATPDANGIAVPAALKDIAITDNIIATAATADITGGVIDFYCYWLPLSADGNVVAV